MMQLPDTLFVGKKLIYQPVTSSTNEDAVTLLSKTNPPEGTCLITDYQTGGKGQIGRKWHSTAFKNILSTFIFYPDRVAIEQQYKISMMVAIAVRQTVSQYIHDAKIKWPNDIYVGDKKIGGILIQNSLSGAKIKQTVVGIGLNVNEEIFPSDLPNPTSIYLEIGLKPDKNDVFRLLCQQLEQQYLCMQKASFTDLQEKYEANLFRKDQASVFYINDGEEIEGYIRGIDEQGRLLIEDNRHIIQSYELHKIRMRL